jgi:V8-like Glu-specific endopeptidase
MMVKKALAKYSLEELMDELEERKESSSGSDAAAKKNNTPIKKSSTIEIMDAIRYIEKSIYETDDRNDLYEMNNQNIHMDADSVVALVSRQELVNEGNGKSKLKSSTFGNSYSLCPSEKFRKQPVCCFCSGFLIGSELVATAGHCVDDGELVKMGISIKDVRFVFGFKMKNSSVANTRISNNEIYKVKEIVKYKFGTSMADWAIVRLDRKVQNHKIVKINNHRIKNNQKLHVIGHPCGLPLKYAGNAKVTDNTPRVYFAANLDTFGGNSGSPVFNSENHNVEGILVRGQPDFLETEKGCNVSRVYPNTGSRGEDCTRTREFFQYVRG